MQMSLRNIPANKPISSRPKIGIAREINILSCRNYFCFCASAWQRIVVRAPPVNKNFDAIRRKWR